MNAEEFESVVTHTQKIETILRLTWKQIGQMTPQQIGVMLNLAIEYGEASSAIDNFPLSNEHADLILDTNYTYGKQMIFEKFNTLTPEQISRGLGDDDFTVRRAAYRHECCTEAQKVWYHLKWGATND